MDRRPRLFLGITCAVALAVAACYNDLATTSNATDLSGEWDFRIVVPAGDPGDCIALGALTLARSGATLTGSATGYVSNCNMPVGGLLGGTVSGSTVAFATGTCSVTGTTVTADSMGGAATCFGVTGTWYAARVGAASRLAVSPGDLSLVVGAVRAYTPTLYDAAGHVLYGRAVAWASSDSRVVSLIRLAEAPGVTATAVAPGTAQLTASSAGQTATATVVVTAASFVSLAGGGSHTCALTPAGAAYCWGNDELGELGDGHDVSGPSTSPVPVVGGLTFSSLSAGFGFTCGVTTGGAAYCWGANGGGSLGTGDSVGSTTPKAVAGGLTFQAVSAGDFHACGIAASGAAWCWG